MSILDQFKSRYGNPQIYVKSPGRANIIGEHTDYNHGLVLPFAIKQCIHMYIGQNQSGLLRVFASDINDSIEIDISDLEFQKIGWIRYFINALVVLGYKRTSGFDIVFGGNLPQGGGVSSSSAITCGFLAGMNSLLDLAYHNDKLIRLASQAENGIGLNGGIMDQTAIIKGKENRALKIDFLDFSIAEIEMPPEEFTFYLFNSGQKHNLVNTEYNRRRKTCENAIKVIQSKKSGVETMRDLTEEDIYKYLSNDVSIKRCVHVIQENNRVLSAVEALQTKKYSLLGQLILESHHSLANNYEVSTDEIDYLVQSSNEIPKILGSRIMGGGFGGCTINFVKGKLDPKEIEKLSIDYKSKTGLELMIDEISACDGVQVSKI